ncbi:hypothetical protein QJS10_CPA09g01148 [Acorus calamus]|uniref:Maltase n=1 Tax=Acorus calamus TaxID=4465 RepID=A0AAV9E752_ACOCL|nr:hypothetical protein QJS10_CPA09g01148 [Acorus calamus]
MCLINVTLTKIDGIQLGNFLPSNVFLLHNFETKDHLRVRITNSDRPRWEVPSSVISRQIQPPRLPYHPLPPRTYYHLSVPGSDLLLTLRSTSPFGYIVACFSNHDALFDASDIVFKDHYLQLSTSLPPGRSSIYGFGEHTKKTFWMVEGDNVTLWNIDILALYRYKNLYGSSPFYMDLRTPSGTTHGVLLLNNNGMDVDLIGRTVTEYHEVFRLHQCRYMYKNVSDLERVVASYAAAGLPPETMWTDINYMDGHMDFTLDPVNFPTDKMNQFLDLTRSTTMARAAR